MNYRVSTRKNFCLSTRKYSVFRPGMVGVDGVRNNVLYAEKLYVDANHECRHQNFVGSYQNVDTKNFYVDAEQLSPSTPITNIDSKIISYVDPENSLLSTPIQAPTYKITSGSTQNIWCRYSASSRPSQPTPTNLQCLPSYTHSHTCCHFARRLPESELSSDFMATCKCDKISPELHSSDVRH